MIFKQTDLAKMPQRYRAHFINSLSGFKSANLIGSVNHAGITNLSVVSSVVHLGADPALLGFINRPHTVARDTLDNIYATGYFSVNHIGQDFFQQAHQASARYPAEISEFSAVGLTEQYTGLPCPYVAQSAIKLGLQFKQKIDIELNHTVMIIGQIVEVIVPENSIEADGKVGIETQNSVCVSGLDEYHTTHSLGRLAYAKAT